MRSEPSMRAAEKRRTARRGAGAIAAAAAALSAAALALPVAAAASGCGAAPPDPFSFLLVPTANANGASGEVEMRFAPSPFGVALTRDGTHDFSLELTVRGIDPPPGTTVVAWVATPDLGTVVRLGSPGADGSLRGRVALNKFLVFLTAERDAVVERWSGPILLRGSSPSGRMHSMAGHGPFQAESCGKIGF